MDAVYIALLLICGAVTVLLVHAVERLEGRS